MPISNRENYCIPHRHKSFDQTTIQSLDNSEPAKPWKYKQLRGLRPSSIISVILGLLIYEGKYSTKDICRAKLMQDDLRGSMILNLTEIIFLQQVQTTELINWDWLRIHCDA